MVQVANDLRANHSPSYIAEQLFEQANKSGKDCVIESLRTVGEIEALRAKGNFTLFAIDADPKTRYDRAFSRASATDSISYETFIENENRELQASDPNKQNLSACIKLADYVIQNDGTLEILEWKIEDIIKKIDPPKTETFEEHIRPTWDEYFMEIMDTVSKRWTCNRGRVGCVIARDRQLLVTWYAGAPKGLPHCDDVGHQFKKMIHEDGSITQHCVRTVHGEQNAICQAAKLWVSIEWATLYCRMTPCRTCAMLLINCGIKKVICEKRYHAGWESEEMLAKAWIELEFFHDEVQQYTSK